MYVCMYKYIDERKRKYSFEFQHNPLDCSSIERRNCLHIHTHTHARARAHIHCRGEKEEEEEEGRYDINKKPTFVERKRKALKNICSQRRRRR